MVEPVQAKDVPVALTVPGRLTFSEDQTWHVGAIATGRIEDLRASLGDWFARARSLAIFIVMKSMRLGRGISRLRPNWSGRDSPKRMQNNGSTARRDFSI